ncbi:MAG: outer membrane beta-barrel protein [Dinghuibacter sp.]|nr:outer membrane beta-barrel protein [Dinghuibacter sp.]
MKKGLLLICVLSIFSFSVYSQAGKYKKIKTTVTDAVTGSPVERASINLLTSPGGDYTEYAGFSDSLGRVTLYMKGSGNFTIEVSIIGYRSQASAPFTVQAADSVIQVPAIKLQRNTKLLSEATVVAKKPLFERKPGKLILNVGANFATGATTAFEIIETSPGVFVDPAYNITMMGRQGVTILLNDKPARLQGSALAEYLKSISSNDIERVEFITNPSAQYDAQGGGGIINIITKRIRRRGMFGNASVTGEVGMLPKFESSLGMNIRNNKISLGTNLLYSHKQSPADFFSIRTLRQPITGAVEEIRQDAIVRNKRNATNIRFDLEYELPKNGTAGIFFMRNGAESGQRYNAFTTLKNNQVPRETIERFSQAESSWNNSTLALSYRQPIGKKQVLSIDADANQYRSVSHTLYQVMLGDVPSGAKNPYQFTNDAPMNIRIGSAKAVYQIRQKKTTTDFGLKYSRVRTDNSFIVDSLIGSNWVNVFSRDDNRFRYNENIFAAYAHYQQEVDSSFSFSAGLRMESTEVNSFFGRSVKTSDSSYTNLFPSFSLTKMMGRKMQHQLSLTYSRRINRPVYSDLNPFITFVDQYDIATGNSRLKAGFSHAAELGLLLNNQYNISIGATRTTDMVLRNMAQNDTTRLATVIRENIPLMYSYYFNIALPHYIRKWWQFYFDLNLSYDRYSASVNTNRGTLVDMRVVNTLFFPKSWSVQSVFSYTHIPAYGFYSIKPYYFFNLACRKLVGEKYTFTFRVTDMFRTNRERSSFNTGNISQQLTNFIEGRIFRLQIQYRFGKSFKEQNNKSTVSQAELERIKKQ